MLLEARLDRGFDLFDAAHDRFDFGARGAVEQRDARARARRVAGGDDFAQIAIGNHAERHRVKRVDMAAERAGEGDALRRSGAEAFDEQLRARVKRRLGELNGAHVGLMDRRDAARPR